MQCPISHYHTVYIYKFYGLILSDMVFKQDKTNRISNLIKFEFNLGNKFLLANWTDKHRNLTL